MKENFTLPQHISISKALIGQKSCKFFKKWFIVYLFKKNTNFVVVHRGSTSDCSDMKESETTTLLHLSQREQIRPIPLTCLIKKIRNSLICSLFCKLNSVVVPEAFLAEQPPGALLAKHFVLFRSTLSGAVRGILLVKYKLNIIVMEKKVCQKDFWTKIIV